MVHSSFRLLVRSSVLPSVNYVHSWVKKRIYKLNLLVFFMNDSSFFRLPSNAMGAAPLLDTDDMIAMGSKPDWKCVFTYVQSLYRHGTNFEKSGGKEPTPPTTPTSPTSPTSPTTPTTPTALAARESETKDQDSAKEE